MNHLLFNAWFLHSRGLYFTATSSKSHDYNTKSEKGLGAGMRATIMCQVMLGKVYKMEKGDQTLTAPPSGSFHLMVWAYFLTGYDSVVGVVGAELNYDEVVVYGEDHVIPKYLIIYKYQ